MFGRNQRQKGERRQDKEREETDKCTKRSPDLAFRSCREGEGRLGREPKESGRRRDGSVARGCGRAEGEKDEEREERAVGWENKGEKEEEEEEKTHIVDAFNEARVDVAECVGENLLGCLLVCKVEGGRVDEGESDWLWMSSSVGVDGDFESGATDVGGGTAGALDELCD